MNCKIISAAAFAALLLLVGCASDASDADTSATSSYIELALLSGSSDHSPDMGETAEQLASRLLASGELGQAVFHWRGGGARYEADLGEDGELTLYEYTDAAEAAEQASQFISDMHGSELRTFYCDGNLIASYEGTNARVYTLMEDVLGPALAR